MSSVVRLVVAVLPVELVGAAAAVVEEGLPVGRVGAAAAVVDCSFCRTCDVIKTSPPQQGIEKRRQSSSGAPSNSGAIVPPRPRDRKATEQYFR